MLLGLDLADEIWEGCHTLKMKDSDPMDCSPLGFSVHGILQARILEWVAMPSSRGSSQPRDQTWVSCITGGFFTEPPGKALVVKNLPTDAGNVRDVSLIPGLGRSAGEHGSPLQYSCLENPMDRGAWWATVLRVTKSQTRLKRLSVHTHTL